MQYTSRPTVLRAGAVFTDLAREALSWEKFSKAVPVDDHSVSPACDASSMNNYDVHLLPKCAVKVSRSVFKITRPAALAMIIHCMTQLLPCILKSTLACYRTLRCVFPLIDLCKLILGKKAAILT
jgi:hypothetical protein